MSGQRQKIRLNAVQRRALMVGHGEITVEEAEILSIAHEHTMGDRIENPIGSMVIPVGIAEHFIVNGRAIGGVPMATEETSVVAAATKAAKLAKVLGGFVVTFPLHATARGHVLYSFSSPKRAAKANAELQRRLQDFVEHFRRDDSFEKYGGGLLHVTSDVRHVPNRSFVTVQITMNPAEAMGANAVTKVGIRLADMIKQACRLDAVGTICTNHRSGWEIEASASWSCSSIGSTRLRRILGWHAFATVDVDRAVTNNKGIMNGVTAVALATGQDTRAIEACVHASSMVNGRYYPLANYWVDPESDLLHGELQLTLPVATKGGMTHHPQAVVYRRLMGATSARELACIMAAVGLAQNFGALHCLAGEGIPAAHATLANSR